MNKLFVLVFAVLFSCGNANQTSSGEISHNSGNEENNHQAMISETQSEFAQEEILLGEFSRSDLEQKPFSEWFNANYEAYSPDEEALETIKNNISEYDITILMGTWCEDSKWETPKLYKILDEAGYDYSRLTSVAVDENKSTPQGIEKKLEVEMVPTVIFSKDGKEINRFVEYPLESFEEDIAKIVSKSEYKNAYAE